MTGKKIILAVAGLLLAGILGVANAADEPTIRVARVADAITPVTAEYVTAELERAEAAGDRAFLLELDTPGGLDTAMRAIIQQLLGAKVPVIVYVYPAGARAASAGALITLAADFAVMAPGTNIGAAHPVSIMPGRGEGEKKDDPMQAKVLNDAAAYARSIAEQRGRDPEWAERIVRESISTPAQEALALRVVDLVAASEEELLKGLDGRGYLRDGRELTLQTQGVVLVRAEMSWRQKLLSALSNPNVAYLLLMLGILGIFFEISQPGVIFPGAIGAIALLLAFYGLQTLPVNYAGVLLILLALVLFLLEIKVTSFGMLTVGGALSLLLGSLLLFESPVPTLRVSWMVIFATVGTCTAFCAFILYHVARTQGTPFVAGAEGMAGERGTAVTAVYREGQVHVHGEYWDAVSAEPIAAGEPVEVVRLESGMRLTVRKVTNNLPESLSH